MSDNEAPQPPSPTGAGEGPQAPPPASRGKSRAFGALVLALTLLIALAAGALAAYDWYRLQRHQSQLLQTRTELAQQVNRAGERTDELQHTLGELEKRLEELSQGREARQKAMATLEQKVQGVREKVADISGIHRVDWLLSEAQYLIRLAHQRLSLTRDPQGAEALLEAADEVVRKMEEPMALPLRKALSRDLASLQTAADVDREGIVLRLGGLSEQLERLRFKAAQWHPERAPEGAPASARRDAGTETAEPVDQAPGWGSPSGFWQRLKAQLGQFYRTRELDKPAEAVLGPDQQAMVRQNLRLLLEQAQLATLRRAESNYRLSLEQAQRLIRQYFDTQGSRAQGMLEALQQLRQRAIDPQLPNIDNSLQAVQRFSEQWQKEKLEREVTSSAPQADESSPKEGQQP